MSKALFPQGRSEAEGPALFTLSLTLHPSFQVCGG